MRYYITLAERTFEVEVGSDHVTINGERVEAELLQVTGTPLRRLSVSGESHRVVAEKGASAGEWSLHLDGYRIPVEVVDERTRTIRAMTTRSGPPPGPKPVRAPMPGMVLRIEVQPGDKVNAGQGVAIIEAMKMENELKAEAAGTVAKVNVQAGTAVQKGAILIEFAVDG